MSAPREPRKYESTQRELDPHRREEQRRAREEAIARLQDRGVHVSGAESDAQVVELLDAVDRFETEVSLHGGDLMVDTGSAEQPDDPIFLLPKRHGHEAVAAYVARIDEATEIVRRRR